MQDRLNLILEPGPLAHDVRAPRHRPAQRGVEGGDALFAPRSTWGRSSGARTRRPGDGYRDPGGSGPIELAGRVDISLEVWIHVLSFTERDALATHFVAKAEIKAGRVTLTRFSQGLHKVGRP